MLLKNNLFILKTQLYLCLVIGQLGNKFNFENLMPTINCDKKKIKKIVVIIIIESNVLTKIR